MPAVSEKQRRYLYAKFGSAWVHKHHFANRGKLPLRAPASAQARKGGRTLRRANRKG